VCVCIEGKGEGDDAVGRALAVEAGGERGLLEDHVGAEGLGEAEGVWLWLGLGLGVGGEGEEEEEGEEEREEERGEWWWWWWGHFVCVPVGFGLCGWVSQTEVDDSRWCDDWILVEGRMVI
jgi:hypothetical protein